MTTLRDLMHETVEHEYADMVRLASRARRRGTSMRRRRRLAAATGSLAVVASVAAGLATAGFLPRGPGEAPGARAYAGPASAPSTSPASPQQCSGARVDLTQTSVPKAGKAFSAALRSVAEGTVTPEYSVRTSATCHAAAAVRVSVKFAPPDGRLAGAVTVSYEPATSTISGVAGYQDMSHCWASMEDCLLETLSDGSVLRTHAVHESLQGVTLETLIAERLVDGYVVRVQAQSSRAHDEAGTVTSPDAVLTTEQLVELVQLLTPVA